MNLAPCFGQHFQTIIKLKLPLITNVEVEVTDCNSKNIIGYYLKIFDKIVNEIVVKDLYSAF